MHSHNLEKDIAPDYWHRLGEVITEEITNSPSSVKQMLEEEYPKLLQNLQNVVQKLAYDKFTFK